MFLHGLLLFLLYGRIQIAYDERIIFIFFDCVDTNNDNKIVREESDAYFEAYDVNNDTIITISEVKQRVHDVNPGLAGNEDKLFGYLDLVKDGIITEEDVTKLYGLIDINNDQAMSRSEFKYFLDNAA